MEKAKIEKLLELIQEAVSADGGWQDKRNMILAEAGDSDKTNLAEFAGWFDDGDAE